MRNLLVLFVAAALVLLNSTAIAQAPPGSLWYNGDFNGVTGLVNEWRAAVYDDFNVTDPAGWIVTGVFSDNLCRIPVGYATWEIRTGVSEGNPGTLVASGDTYSPVVTATGRSLGDFNEYMIAVSGLNLTLAPGTYWLNVTPWGYLGQSYNTTTSGANCVGTPCGNDDNAFFNSTYFGAYFTSTLNECGDDCHDFSDGVIGTVVPEPATGALLTCGLGALLIALRCRCATKLNDRAEP